MRVDRRPPRKQEAHQGCRTLRLLLLPQPLPPRLTPRTPELGLRSQGQEQEMATPRVFPLSLQSSAWVPWSRDSLTRKQNGLSLPDPPRRKNQDYKPRTLLHREGPTGSSGHPHPSLILFFWRGGEVLWAVPPSTQGLSSLTGDRPRAPALGVWSLNHSSHTEVPCPSTLI